ncbi:hypothetical protein, partial [Listeria welshimeri]|uniref:hypothetical protein n=1 Tax=Listeria welshimeri TaxID=1643 RepID=UPI0032047172
MNTINFKEIVKPSNDFYYMVEWRAKSKAPVSCAKPVQKSSTKVALIKPETGVLLAQDPWPLNPIARKFSHGSRNKKQKYPQG